MCQWEIFSIILPIRFISRQNDRYSLQGLEFMICKYKKTSCVINEIQHLYVSFPLYFLPIPSSFHLRGKKPFKWTPTETINNHNSEALSYGTILLCFHKCDKSNGATLFFPSTNQIRALLCFILEQFAYGKVLPKCFDPQLTTLDFYKSKVKLCSVCLSVHLKCVLWTLDG